MPDTADPNTRAATDPATDLAACDLALPAEMQAGVDDTLERFNGNHADTVLLLARYGAGCADATDAEVLAADRGGLALAVAAGGARRTVRLDFAAVVPPTGALDELRAAVLGQVVASIGAARANAGERVGVTSFERELSTTGSLPTYVTAVAAVRDLSPNLREVVVAGGLDAFRPLGGDQFVYVFVARPGGEPIPDEYSMAEFMAAPATERPFGAYYTVRSFDPAGGGRMVLWMVTHGADAGVGSWVERCAVGDRVALWGPRAGFERPEGAARHLFVVDETGLPAVVTLIEELPAGAEVQVVADTVDEEHVIELTDRPGVQVRWLFRRDEAPGTGTRLLDAVRDLDLAAGGVDGLVAFGAAESRQVTAIRTYLRRELGLPATHVSMTGYWRHDPTH